MVNIDKYCNDGLTTEWRARLPKRLQERLGSVSRADDLIDGCKYIITCAKGYRDIMGHIEGASFPIRSFAEAVNVLENEYEKIS